MQKFGLHLVTGPTAEPVSLVQAKSHLRVDFADDDALIASLITAAREFVENYLNRAIFNQTWLLTLDQFPFPSSITTYTPSTRENYFGNGLFFDWVGIELPMPRLSSVTSITYVSGNPATTITVDPSTYVVDANSEPARIVPANGGSWPYPGTYVPGSVKITYVTGTFGDGVTTNTCPASIAQAMLLLIGLWYANREAAMNPAMVNLPFAVDALLSPYKFHQLVY